MGSPHAQRMRFKALDILHQRHEDANLNARSLASALGISRRQLDRLFHGRRPVSVVLLELRLLTSAHRLLADASDTVAEVAFQSGFKDVNTFRTHFGETFAMTPSQFRRRHGAVGR